MLIDCPFCIDLGFFVISGLFGVFTVNLFEVLFLCELLFLYFSFLVGSLLYLNYYQIISFVWLIYVLAEF